MKKVEETYYCDCCGKMFNPDRTEFQPCTENKYKRAEVRFLVPRLVTDEYASVFDKYTRYDSIVINDICDECMNKLVDFTEEFIKTEDE